MHTSSVTVATGIAAVISPVTHATFPDTVRVSTVSSVSAATSSSTYRSCMINSIHVSTMVPTSGSIAPHHLADHITDNTS